MANLLTSHMTNLMTDRMTHPITDPQKNHNTAAGFQAHFVSSIPKVSSICMSFSSSLQLRTSKFSRTWDGELLRGSTV